jgi:hypothetical protein
VRLSSGLSLAYCTNVHRGESWAETFHSLKTHALRVRDRVAAGRPFVLGLRLSDQASRELIEAGASREFRLWLEKENCLVAGINGFPFAAFHGQTVKENVFAPDWSQPERLTYTQRLFDLLGDWGSLDGRGTVSTLPGTFKGFAREVAAQKTLRKNILQCAEFLARWRDRTGVAFKLALEPEPLGLIENTSETIQFFEQLRKEEPSAGLVEEFLGVCFDTCHFALQYEDAAMAIHRLNSSGAPVVKFHLSSALRLKPNAITLKRLSALQEPTYLHQCLGRTAQGEVVRFKDIPEALMAVPRLNSLEELRVHFHVPVQVEGLIDGLTSTRDYLQSCLDVIAQTPQRYHELEIETYTWEVLPPASRTDDVVDQIVAEYHWVLDELKLRGINSV